MDIAHHFNHNHHKRHTKHYIMAGPGWICSFPSLQGVNQEIFSLGARFSIHSLGRDVFYTCVKLHINLPSNPKIVRKSAEPFLTIIWMILIFRRRRSLGGPDSWSGIWGNVGISWPVRLCTLQYILSGCIECSAWCLCSALHLVTRAAVH